MEEAKEMNYDEAREKLKEVEILLSHRKPILVYKGLDDEATHLFAFLTCLIITPATVALSVLVHPLFWLVPVLPIGTIVARMRIGDPTKGVSSVLQKIFLTKKQRAMTAEAYKVEKEYDKQRKIFDLYLRQKIDALKDEGVFEVLHQGIQESYPWIDEETGEVDELSPKAWKTKNEQIEMSNDLSTKENLRELLSSNPDIIKSLST